MLKLRACPNINSSRANSLERDKDEVGGSAASIIIVLLIFLTCAICACCYCYIKKARKEMKKKEKEMRKRENERYMEAVHNGYISTTPISDEHPPAPPLYHHTPAHDPAAANQIAPKPPNSNENFQVLPPVDYNSQGKQCKLSSEYV